MVPVPLVLKKVLGAGLAAIALLLVLQSFFLLYVNYQNHCPEKDVLSWDANLRLATVLDQIRDAKKGDWWDFFKPYWQSPTWPMLRSVGSLMALTLGARVQDDFWITAGTAALLIFLFFFCFYYLTGDGLATGAAGIVFVSLFLHTSELPAYVFSSMLEVQGMLFTLLAVVSLFLVYRAAHFRVQGRLFWLTLFSLQGLAHTKYPYGLLFLGCLLLVDILRQPRPYLGLLQSVLLGSWWRWPGLFLLLLALGGLIWAPGLKGKANIICLAGLLWLLLWQVRLMRSGLETGNNAGERAPDAPRPGPVSFYYIYYAGLLPFALWILLQPDRVVSILDSQVHAQAQQEWFAGRLFTSVFDHPILLAALIFAALALQLVSFWQRRPWNGIEKNALWCLLLLGLQFLVLELSTDNKQLRHIYHLLPAGIFTLLILLYIRTDPAPGFSFAVRSLQYLLPVLALALLFYPGGLFSGSYIEKRIYCFTGTTAGIYDPARQVAAHLPGARSVIVLQAFAHPAAPLPGRLMTTEIDLLLRDRARLQGQTLYSQREHEKNPGLKASASLSVAQSASVKDSVAIYYVRETCQNSFYDPLARPFLEHYFPEFQSIREEKLGADFCVSEFRRPDVK